MTSRPLYFRRGRTTPKAIRWFGLRSFYGHLWHLVASAIATRTSIRATGCTPTRPRRSPEKIALLLDESATEATSLTESLGRDLYIDCVADTGDDVEVSRAVAELVVEEYEVPHPEGGPPLVVPRGDILLFGGDTAYPVATATEIEARVLAPWNDVLGEHHDGRRRVLLGIPGNHDWFDGLDGFARMFRGRSGPLEEGRESMAPGAESRRTLRFVDRGLRHGQALGQATRAPALWLRTRSTRELLRARARAPASTYGGSNRQLKQINFQQRRFFWERRNAAPTHTLLLCLPNPLRAYLQSMSTGTAMMHALGLDPLREPMLWGGRRSHYERSQMGPSVHLVAGGGGAFLHEAGMARDSATGTRASGTRARLAAPAVEFPGPRVSRALLWSVPARRDGGRGAPSLSRSRCSSRRLLAWVSGRRPIR